MANLVFPGCDIDWQPDHIAEVMDWAWQSPANDWRESDAFFMEFQVGDAILSWPEDGRPRRLSGGNPLGLTCKREFAIFTRDELLSKDRNLALQDLCSLLSLLGVPSLFHAPFARHIYCRAALFADEISRMGRGRRVIPLVVEIDIFEYEGDDEDEIMPEVLRSSLDDEVGRLVPATKASIDSLEKAEVEDVDVDHSTDKCMICLEQLSSRSELSRMPCSHLYHGDCIVQWLETSHICPLCRFEMPTN